MNKDFSMFRYFKGEEKNPYSEDSQNAQYYFWGFEKGFEDKFNSGNFDINLWAPYQTPDIKEWETALSGNQIDKSELFKIWLFNLLMVYLREKYQSENDKWLRLYYDTKP